MTLEELMNRELKVYFHADQKIPCVSDPAAITA
jgi:hypothetical protein